MSKRIPESFIDEIIARADIVDVVGRRVSLKQAGANLKGLCPFHDEKTPSFTVSPVKGFYHCFGCGAHGTAIRFLMEYENLSFPESVEALADMLGLEMPATSMEATKAPNDDLLELLREADQLYRRFLRESSVAIEYLKERGIDGETAARFGLGFAPDAWDTLRSALGTTQQRADDLLRAGLLSKNDSGRVYDRFRNRIMFPIRNARGQVLGFGGRVIGDGEPKYLNSPETPVFHKGRTLYGVYEARQLGRRPEEALVVEGYLDVASLSQHEITPALATLGTATTPDHVRQLTRIADRVVFCFDGDRAGRAAAWRALETALPFGGGKTEIGFLVLPEGEDPDSFVRERGAGPFRRLLGDALPLGRFLIGELATQADLAHADGRAKFVTLAKALLAKLPDGIYKTLLISEIAEVVGMSSDTLGTLIDAPTTVRGPLQEPTQGTEHAAPQKATLVRKAVALVLHYPAVAARLKPVAGFERVAQPGTRLLRDLLEFARSRPDIRTAHLIERFRDDPEGRYLERLLATEPLDDEEAALGVLSTSLERIVAADERRRIAAAVRGRGDVAQ
jgi:DNA primase